MKHRWRVSYAHKETINDLDLMRSMRYEYFDNEADALRFASENKHKGKPNYWQPIIEKEVEKTFTTKKWVLDESE